jgi:hypothetical protein
VEVREQYVHDMETLARPQEQLGTTARCAAHRTLEGAHRRRSDGDDARRVADTVQHVGRHRVVLAVHAVTGGIVDGHGPERVESDDQFDAYDVDSPSGKPREHRMRQVQARSRRRHRRRPAGVDGLVALRVDERLGDVRRQRHPAVGLHDGARIVAGDLDDEQAVSVTAEHLEHGNVVGGQQRLRWPELAGVANERTPTPGRAVQRFEEEHLDVRATRAAEKKPSGQHARVVEDNDVTRPQQVREVTDVTVLGRRRRTAIDEEPSAVTRLDGVLGDPIERQRVVVLRHAALDPHDASG